MENHAKFVETIVPSRFAGKRIFLTGAGSGIGKAVAQRLAKEGGALYCVDLRGQDETVAEITAAGGTAHGGECDVTSAAAVEQSVEAAVAALGGLDIVCNIAGIGHFAWSHEEDPEWFDRIVKVNLNGTFYVIRYALPHLLATGNGVIVNTASNSGLMGAPWSAAYCSSKGGVVNLTRALAIEYRNKGVRAVAIAPGGTKTNIIASFSTIPEGGDYRDMQRIMTPIPVGEPEEMAAAFAFVASDEARYMTGAIVSVDGGLAC